jgi:hypothetical protein
MTKDERESAETTEKRGFLRLLLGTLIRPAATMRALSRQQRRWWGVIALLMLVALGAHAFAYANANAEHLYQSQLEFYENMTEEERGPYMQPPERRSTPLVTIAVRLLGSVVGTVVTWLIWAGALYLLGVFFGQNGAKFGGLFAMTLWAWVPYVVRNIVQAVYMFVTNHAIYNQGLSGLAYDQAPPTMFSSFQPYVAPSTGDLLLARVLGRVDIYTVWNVVLLIAGVHAFSQLGRRKSIWLTVGLWLLFTALTLLPALIGVGGGMRMF